MGRKTDIAIIGAGKVGTALGILAAEAGYHVTAVACKTLKHAEVAAARISPDTKALSAADAAGMGRLVLLTVPDGAIAGLCEELAAAGAMAKGTIVAHCCGAFGSDILVSARKGGCAIGAMHPLQTFPTVEAAVERLPGAWCFVDGDDEAVSVLTQLAADIGGRPQRIDPSGKALYHASAAMASNHLAALMDAATALAGGAGIEPQVALAALGPLVRATLENVLAMGPEQALTGPVARGDAATVDRHVKAMKASKLPVELRAFYKAAATWTIELALRKGTIDQADAQELKRALES